MYFSRPSSLRGAERFPVQLRVRVCQELCCKPQGIGWRCLVKPRITDENSEFQGDGMTCPAVTCRQIKAPVCADSGAVYTTVAC